MASLLAASRQDPAAAYGLHARTETVRLGAAAFARLKCALWQSNPPMFLRSATREYYADVAQAGLPAKFELSSVLVHGGRGQESDRWLTDRGKVKHPGHDGDSRFRLDFIARVMFCRDPLESKNIDLSTEV